jgi:hypothetical protein
MSEESVVYELFNEVLSLAEDENETVSLERFVSFVREFLPSDIIQQLEIILGGEDFLCDIYNEKYSKQDVDEEAEEESLSPMQCRICERTLKLTRHHLIPQQLHAKYMKKGMEKDHLNKTVDICRLCHSTVHRLFTNSELASTYNTLESLLSEQRVIKYAKWASKLSNRCGTKRA